MKVLADIELALKGMEKWVPSSSKKGQMGQNLIKFEDKVEGNRRVPSGEFCLHTHVHIWETVIS